MKIYNGFKGGYEVIEKKKTVVEAETNDYKKRDLYTDKPAE